MILGSFLHASSASVLAVGQSFPLVNLNSSSSSSSSSSATGGPEFSMDRPYTAVGPPPSRLGWLGDPSSDSERIDGRELSEEDA